MIYGLVRWLAGFIVFFLMIAILILVTKKTGKAILISAFTAVITVAVLLVVPVENAFYSFKSVEDVFNYRYHEKLLTYAECDEGLLCVAQKDSVSYVYYSFPKGEEGYKLPKELVSTVMYRSSKSGVYIFRKFENQTLILTQVSGSEYDGNAFTECKRGYYTYTVVDGDFDYSLLTCNGEKVKLV